MRTSLSLLAILASACAPYSAPARYTFTKTLYDPDAAVYTCGDTVLNDQATNWGNKPITTIPPCWDRSAQAARHVDDVEDRVLVENAREHAVDHAAIEAPTVAAPEECEGLPAREREAPPLANRHDIDEVVPERVGGALLGVRILFKPESNVTAPGLRHLIACHQARFALVAPEASAALDDPTLAPGAHVTVAQRPDHVEVVVLTDSDREGAAAYNRAKALAKQDKVYTITFDL